MPEFRQASRTFQGPNGSVQALNRISFSVQPGKLVAVHDPSAFGMSTLLLCAGTLLRPDFGQVLNDGQDIYRLPAGRLLALRSRGIGFIFRRFHLIPYLTVLENGIAAAEARPGPSGRSARPGTAGSFPSRSPSHCPHQLSVGEQQRVAPARALMNDPCMVLVDEPTGNLDDANSEIVIEQISELAEGRVVLVVTHDRRVAQASHRTLQMIEGDWRRRRFPQSRRPCADGPAIPLHGDPPLC